MAGLIIFMGPTGAGKSIQAERLAAEFDFVHISSGDLLRRDATEAAVMATGQLVPSVDVERLVSAAVTAVAPDQAIILDGFPRSLDEAVWLEGQLNVWGRTLSHVVLFEIDEAASASRLEARQRPDDTPAALKRKWQEYRELTEPVVAHYDERSWLTRVDGNASVDHVFQQLQGVLT